MYKYLLCWRYLRHRYIALASIISVMLGVATMIVVNSVMAGFSYKMRDRLHGVLADVIVESHSMEGFDHPEEVMARIEDVSGGDVVAMARTLDSFGYCKFTYNGHPITRQVNILGVYPLERAKTGDFAEFLFANAADVRDKKNMPPSFEITDAVKQVAVQRAMGGPSSIPDDDEMAKLIAADVKAGLSEHGAIIGWSVGHVHHEGKDITIAPPGTKIGLIFPTEGVKPAPGYDDFTVVGYFKSGMSEYDSTHVYVPLDRFQYVRHMVDKDNNGSVTQVQLKLRAGADLDVVARRVQDGLNQLRPATFRVSTWEEKQGPLLAAVAVEQGILNILLFMIIAVAGFGILAIFAMIVVEKTRDIGVLKALGASSSGVRKIFLFYGLSLGMVGSGVGMIGGLIFVWKINTIEGWLSKLTGRKVFDDAIYYFDSIPTKIEPFTVAWIVCGALLIAVLASIWPAHRASKLRPVQALRFE